LEKNKDWSDGVLEWWSIGVVEKNKDWRNGVLGLKAEIDLIYALLPLVMRDLYMVYICPLYQPFIIPLLSTRRRPVLQVLLAISIL